jgi:hypothetical protein
MVGSACRGSRAAAIWTSRRGGRRDDIEACDSGSCSALRRHRYRGLVQVLDRPDLNAVNSAQGLCFQVVVELIGVNEGLLPGAPKHRQTSCVTLPQKMF